MAEAGIKDIFYHQLRSILDSVSTSNTIILMGDLNAKVGNYSPADGRGVGNHGLGIRNEKETRIVECCDRWKDFLS